MPGKVVDVVVGGNWRRLAISESMYAILVMLEVDAFTNSI